jgi:hypothetical protein
MLFFENEMIKFDNIIEVDGKLMFNLKNKENIIKY